MDDIDNKIIDFSKYNLKSRNIDKEERLKRASNKLKIKLDNYNYGHFDRDINQRQVNQLGRNINQGPRNQFGGIVNQKQVNQFDRNINQGQRNQFGGTINQRQVNQFGRNINQGQRNQFGGTINQRQVNQFGRNINQGPRNQFGGTINQRQVNQFGRNINQGPRNQFGGTINQRQVNQFDRNINQGPRNQFGGTVNQRQVNRFGRNINQGPRNQFGRTVSQRRVNQISGNSNTRNKISFIDKFRYVANSYELNLVSDGKYFDYDFLILIIFVIVFGIIMIYSSSSLVSYNRNLDDKGFLYKQLISLIVAFIIGLMTYIVLDKGYKYFLSYKFIKIYLIVMALFQWLPFFFDSANGSHRWINIKGFTMQPSEFMKFAMIIFTAYISLVSKYIKNMYITIFYLIVLVISILPIILTNLTTAIIISLTSFVVYFIGVDGVKDKIFVMICGISGIFMGILYKSYRLSRISSWKDEANISDQIREGFYAISSGGMFGRGIGNGIQKLKVPENYNDMIFASIIEEIGFLGGVILIILLLFIMYKIYIISKNTENELLFLVGCGISFQVFIQMILNIMIVLKIIPATGVAFPLVSYGGTSIIAFFIEFSLIFFMSSRKEKIGEI